MTRSEFSKYKQITLNIGSLKDTGDQAQEKKENKQQSSNR